MIEPLVRPMRVAKVTNTTRTSRISMAVKLARRAQGARGTRYPVPIVLPAASRTRGGRDPPQRHDDAKRLLRNRRHGFPRSPSRLGVFVVKVVFPSHPTSIRLRP